ncbi:hypothetical protein SAMN04488523_10821 [Sulfitobacter brevis]|uniref:Uncharacterized protein n=1 Tax=Sulfitobacter brevis TaxID=74348 RepID=A0A1I2B847_9RHOB|nr:hypothetical protein SAMN04488523_10821 [Sulfitobacter brevis]
MALGERHCVLRDQSGFGLAAVRFENFCASRQLQLDEDRVVAGSFSKLRAWAGSDTLTKGGQPTFAAATMNVCSAETSVSAIRFWARVSMKTDTLRVWRQLGWHFAKAVFPAKLLADKNDPHERQHESGDQFIDHRKAGKHRAFFMVSAPVRRRLVVSKILIRFPFSRSGHRVWSVRSQAHRHPCFLRWFRTSA